jgi:hypothetical protein
VSVDDGRCDEPVDMRSDVHRQILSALERDWIEA